MKVLVLDTNGLMPSQDDVNYFNNFITYGYEEYPFCLRKPRSVTYPTQFKYYYLVRNNNTNYYFVGSEGEALYAPKTNEQITTSTPFTSTIEIIGSNVKAGTSAGNLPSGNVQNSVMLEFKYIKENYTKTADLPKELPTISSGDAGKVLKVNSGETGVEWGTAGSGDSPIYRLEYNEDFTAAKYTAAVTAHNAGKLVLLDDLSKNYHNIALLGVYDAYSKETDVTYTDTVNVSSPDFTSLLAALPSGEYNNSWYFTLEVNGTEWGDIVFENDVISRDWLEIDLDNNTINTNGETLTTLKIYVNENVPFMSFVKSDCYVSWDGNNVYSGTNYQFYESGNVYVNDVYISQPASSDVPDLTVFTLSDGNNNVIDLSSVEISGFVDGDDKYHWSLENLTYSLDVNNSYSFSFSAGDITGGDNGVQFTADGGDYAAEAGAFKFFATPGMGTFDIQYDQNYSAGEQHLINNLIIITG